MISGPEASVTVFALTHREAQDDALLIVVVNIGTLRGDEAPLAVLV